MAYINVEDQKPMDGVQVFIVTKSGSKGIAKYWGTVGRWLTMDENLKQGDEVVKWKYADAKHPERG